MSPDFSVRALFLHPGFFVGAGAGAAVFALGGVEVVAEGELDSLGIHVVGLPDSVAAEIGVDVIVGETGEVAAFEAQHQRAVLQQAPLDGGGEVEIDIGKEDVLSVAFAVQLTT